MTVKIETGHTVPPLPQNVKKGSKYIEMLLSLGEDDSIFFPNGTDSRVSYVRRMAKRHDIQITARKEPEGIRVWRVFD